MVYAQAAASEPRQVLEQIDELLASLAGQKPHEAFIDVTVTARK